MAFLKGKTICNEIACINSLKQVCKVLFTQYVNCLSQPEQFEKRHKYFVMNAQFLAKSFKCYLRGHSCNT